MSDQDEVSSYAKGLGLCGEPFGYHGVCDEPAGHKPIAPPEWMHSETIGGPVDKYRMAQYAAEQA